MLWKILLELLFLGIILFAGSPFWSCLKTPRHLHNMLSNPMELMRFIDHVGYDKLRADALKVQAPPFGTFGDTITIWETAHYKSLSQTHNGLLFVVLAVLAASWWLGMWFLAASLSVFLLIGFLAEAGRNNNFSHLESVILNLMAWHREDESACEGFCHRQRPEYRNLYDVLPLWEQEMAVSPCGQLAVAKERGPLRILVVDDEEAVRENICAMLGAEGYVCQAVAGGVEALDLLESGERFDLLTSDILNSPMDGLTLLERTKENFPDIPVVILADIDDASVAVACVRGGADEYISRPVNRERLLAFVGALARRRMKPENGK